MSNSSGEKLTFKALSEDTWKDFVKLMGERGGCGGCWCMTWRAQPKEFSKNKGAGNKRAMHKLVKAGEPIGVIGYLNAEPIGWCAVAPREKFIRLENSRVLKRIDDRPVWSVTCFFVIKEYRRKGLSTELLKGVIKYCRKNRVKIIEGYPSVPYSTNIPAAFAWTGIPSAFKKAGFKMAARRSRTRPIMRYYL
jgi:GNAT superfamily N-acetyltransferase